MAVTSNLNTISKIHMYNLLEETPNTYITANVKYVSFDVENSGPSISIRNTVVLTES